MSKLIVPQWPLPKGVAACSSSRIGGVSLPPYDSLNLGAHCGDNPDHVEENRKRLFAAGNLPSKPVWLEQVHGKDVLKLTGEPYASKRADASYSNTPGTVCAVDEPISRHPTKRTHMAVHPMGKPAVTHYRIMEHFRVHTRLRLRLETGRTHQIRVHMAHITHPLVGDPVYGGRPRPPKGASEAFISMLRKFDRQALHATMLRLYHPISGIEMEWHAPIPQDMVELIEVMRADFEEHKDEVDWL